MEANSLRRSVGDKRFRIHNPLDMLRSREIVLGPRVSCGDTASVAVICDFNVESSRAKIVVVNAYRAGDIWLAIPHGLGSTDHPEAYVPRFDVIQERVCGCLYEDQRIS